MRSNNPVRIMRTMPTVAGLFVRPSIDHSSENCPFADSASNGFPRTPSAAWSAIGIRSSSAVCQKWSSSDVGLAVGDVLDEARDEHRRIEDLRVETVMVLLPQALRGVAGTGPRRAVVLPVRAAPHLHRTTGRDVLAVVDQWAALDEPAVATFAQRDQPRRTVAVLVGDMADPRV